MTVLLDTNVLLRYTKPTDPAHHTVIAAIAALQAAGEDLGVVPQNLYEFWVVATRPLANNVGDFARYPGITVLDPTTVADLRPLHRRQAPPLDRFVVKLPPWRNGGGQSLHERRLFRPLRVLRSLRVLWYLGRE